MKVYAGVDPLSGKRLYLTETVPAGLRALAEAKKVRTRLIGQIDEQRNPRTRATVNQLMDRYLDVVDVGVTTRGRYEGVIRLHVCPLLGELPVSGSRARQSTPSTGLRSTRSTPRNRRGVTHNPHPPPPQQAAARHRSVRDGPWWGAPVGPAMTTGAVAESCAPCAGMISTWIRAVLNVRSAIAREGSQTWEKDIKTHEKRRIALDQTIACLLRAYRGQCGENAAALDVEIAGVRPHVLLRAGPLDMAHAIVGQSALRSDVRSPRLGHKHRRTAPLLRHRADLRRGRCPHGRGPTRPRRGRHDNPAHLCRVGSGSRPTRGGNIRRTHASSSGGPR